MSVARGLSTRSFPMEAKERSLDYTLESKGNPSGSSMMPNCASCGIG